MANGRGQLGRWLRFVALCLMGGGVMTVLTAWGLALFKEVSWDRHASRVRASRDLDPAAGEGTGRVTVERFKGTGAEFYEAFVMAGGGSGSTFSTSSMLSSGGALPARDPTPEELVPAWILPRVVPWAKGRRAATDPMNYAYVDVRGWPLLALYCTYDIDRSTGKLVAKTRGGLELGGKVLRKGSWYDGGYPPSLPLMPRWAGVAGNTAFYGVGIAAVVLGVGGVRRWMRRRRGGCVGCGYDLKGVAGACPECGREVRDASESPITA